MMSMNQVLMIQFRHNAQSIGSTKSNPLHLSLLLPLAQSLKMTTLMTRMKMPSLGGMMMIMAMMMKQVRKERKKQTLVNARLAREM